MRKTFLTICGLGSFRYASGTIASLAALLILIGFQQLLPNTLIISLLLWTVIFIVIYITSLIFIKQELKKDYDQSWIVIDEFLGIMVAYLPILLLDSYRWWYLVLIFVLFRFFDIVKPLGIKKIDQKDTPTAVLLDDIIAGFYSLVVFYIIISVLL